MARGRSESRDGTEMVVAVDVGSAMVRVVGAEIGADGGAEIFSFGQTKAVGIRRGIVEDVDEASYAIRAALESAGLEAVVRGARVVAGISGVHVRSFNAVGEAAVNRGDSVITERDVVKARAAAQTQAAACDDVVLHSAPGGIRVDGYLCRRSPVGMRGALVQAETRVVTAGEEAVERLRQAARMAGVEIDEVLSSVVAAGRAAVQRAEAEAGILEARQQAEAEIEAFRARYPGRLAFEYRLDGNASRRPFLVEAMWHDGQFTYLRSRAQELPALYELRDGEPALVAFDLTEDGLYIARHVLADGWLQIGDKRMRWRFTPGDGLR